MINWYKIPRLFRQRRSCHWRENINTWEKYVGRDECVKTNKVGRISSLIYEKPLDSELEEWQIFIEDLYYRIMSKNFQDKDIAFSVPLTKIQEFKIKKILNEQEGFLLRIGVEQSVISTCNCFVVFLYSIVIFFFWK